MSADKVLERRIQAEERALEAEHLANLQNSSSERVAETVHQSRVQTTRTNDTRAAQHRSDTARSEGKSPSQGQPAKLERGPLAHTQLAKLQSGKPSTPRPDSPVLRSNPRTLDIPVKPKPSAETAQSARHATQMDRAAGSTTLHAAAKVRSDNEAHLTPRHALPQMLPTQGEATPLPSSGGFFKNLIAALKAVLQPTSTILAQSQKPSSPANAQATHSTPANQPAAQADSPLHSTPGVSQENPASTEQKGLFERLAAEVKDIVLTESGVDGATMALFQTGAKIIGGLPNCSFQESAVAAKEEKKDGEDQTTYHQVGRTTSSKDPNLNRVAALAGKGDKLFG